MVIKVYGKKIGKIITNRRLTINEAMYAIGYDINNNDDCKKGYINEVEGFYLDDCGNYFFDVENAEMDYNE